MKRCYRCPVIGTGSDGDDFRPSVARFENVSWAVREDFHPGLSCIVVEVDASPVQHAAIALDPSIEVVT